MTNPEGLILVISTVETAEDADQLAASLVEDRLAACVQIDGPITSHFRWKDELNRATEYRLMIKTSRSLWAEVHQHLEQVHPYDQPEIIMHTIDDANRGYHRWVIEQTQKPD